jgi:tetratricopeptide (TPR) repeat protein
LLMMLFSRSPFQTLTLISVFCNCLKALRIRNTVYGRGLVVADTYLCIGNTYLELGKHIDAFDNFKESILIREELLEEHEAVTTETNFISEAREPDENAVHQYSKLIECFEAFFPLYKRLHNEPKVAVGYLQKMGEAYFKIQDYDRAMGRYVLMRTYLVQVSSIITDISDIFQVSSCTR